MTAFIGGVVDQIDVAAVQEIDRSNRNHGTIVATTPFTFADGRTGNAYDVIIVGTGDTDLTS